MHSTFLWVPICCPGSLHREVLCIIFEAMSTLLCRRSYASITPQCRCSLQREKFFSVALGTPPPWVTVARLTEAVFHWPSCVCTGSGIATNRLGGWIFHTLKCHNYVNLNFKCRLGLSLCFWQNQNLGYWILPSKLSEAVWVCAWVCTHMCISQPTPVQVSESPRTKNPTLKCTFKSRQIEPGCPRNTWWKAEKAMPKRHE